MLTGNKKKRYHTNGNGCNGTVDPIRSKDDVERIKEYFLSNQRQGLRNYAIWTMGINVGLAFIGSGVTLILVVLFGSRRLMPGTVLLTIFAEPTAAVHPARAFQFAGHFSHLRFCRKKALQDFFSCKAALYAVFPV